MLRIKKMVEKIEEEFDVEEVFMSHVWEEITLSFLLKDREHNKLISVSSHVEIGGKFLSKWVGVDNVNHTIIANEIIKRAHQIIES